MHIDWMALASTIVIVDVHGDNIFIGVVSGVIVVRNYGNIIVVCDSDIIMVIRLCVVTGFCL